jgi:hypothetical protein
MRTILIFALIGLILGSCVSDNTNSGKRMDDEYFVFNQKENTLMIDFDKLKRNGITLKSIDLKNEDNNSSQKVFLEEGKIKRLENLKDVHFDQKYVNTWFEFDKQGNLVYVDSYFNETYLSQENDSVFMECFLINSFYQDRVYAIVGDYNQSFILNVDKAYDTIFQNEKGVLKIPVNNYRLGKNKSRFVIYDETTKKDTIRRRMVFVEKEFVINEKRK